MAISVMHDTCCNEAISTAENQAFESTTDAQEAVGHGTSQGDLISNPLYGSNFNQSAATSLSSNPVDGLLGEEGSSSEIIQLDTLSNGDQRYKHQPTTQGEDLN